MQGRKEVPFLFAFWSLQKRRWRTRQEAALPGGDLSMCQRAGRRQAGHKRSGPRRGWREQTCRLGLQSRRGFASIALKTQLIGGLPRAAGQRLQGDAQEALGAAATMEGVAMKKWEYLTLRVYGGKVIEANDQRVGDLKGPFPTQDSPRVHEYLNQLGEEGWQVAGMSPTSGTSQLGGGVWVLVVLRRRKA